jgi:membrane-bound hydrogenase subunit beta
MEETLAVQAELIKSFPAIRDKVRVQRRRRVFADVPYESFPDVFAHAVRQMRFSILCTITGLDLGGTLGVIYHLARESGVTLNLCTTVPKNHPVLQTVTDNFPAAELYERELVDLLGMQVSGLPEGPRYPLPDEWPPGQFPLRKDWKPESPGPGPAKPSEAKNA